MVFEQIATGGCQSYVVGCEASCQAVIIDPVLQQVDRYLGLINRAGLRVKYVVDTHTHADHFSGTRQLGQALGVPVVMHRASPSQHADMRIDDGDMLAVGDLRLQALHTPGHTADSMCLKMSDRVFTGDTLLIGATGRTDLPTGDPDQLYDSLFGKLLTLDPDLRVYPAHDYKGRSHSTIGDELATNPRLGKRERGAFVQMMRELNLSAPDHMTEALRTNMNGGKTVQQMLAEAAARVPFMSMAELAERASACANDFVILDVREREAYEAGHVPNARHVPRGQLELRINQAFPDPTLRIVTVCELGKVSTLAAATLRDLGFRRAAALDGGMKTWREAGYPVERGDDAAPII